MKALEIVTVVVPSRIYRVRCPGCRDVYQRTGGRKLITRQRACIACANRNRPATSGRKGA